MGGILAVVHSCFSTSEFSSVDKTKNSLSRELAFKSQRADYVWREIATFRLLGSCRYNKKGKKDIKAVLNIYHICNSETIRPRNQEEISIE